MSRGLCMFAAIALMVAGASRAAHASCAPRNADPVQTIRQLYAAVTRGDSLAVSRLFAPDFYAFDKGERMTGAELADQVDQIRKAKLPFIWTVEDAEPHVSCDVAWVTYTNRHVPLPGATAQPAAFVESVVLVWRGGMWKLRFFHSTPAPSP